MNILLAADVHGSHDLEKLSEASILGQIGLDPGQIDYLIVLGDWGVIWNDDPAWLAEEFRLLAFFDSKPWETLVILGNHEGYSRIRRIPLSERHGAPVRRASMKVFILESGNIFTLGGRRFFVFGGAESVDKANRQEGRDWWPEETPSLSDARHAVGVLESVNGEVDFVLTHTCPTEVANHLATVDSIFRPKSLDPTCQVLSALQNQVKGSPPWFFGHFHVDLRWRNFRCLFEDLVVIGLSDESNSQEPLPRKHGTAE